MPNLEVSSFVTLGICWNQIRFTYEQLELSRESCARLAHVWQFDCQAGRIEIVTFTIQCEVLNVKTEVKSFKSVNQASHDTGPSEFKERKRFYGSYVYSAWHPSSCRYNTHTQCQTVLTDNYAHKSYFTALSRKEKIRTTLPNVDKSINHLGRYVGLSEAWFLTVTTVDR